MLSPWCRYRYHDSLDMRRKLGKRGEMDSSRGMNRPGRFRKERAALVALARDGSLTHRLARRANALVSRDDDMSCARVARLIDPPRFSNA